MARPGGVKIIVKTNLFAALERLRLSVELESAAFKDACFYAAPRKFQSKRYTCHPATDNADFRMEYRSAWKFSRIDKHTLTRPPFPLEYSCNYTVRISRRKMRRGG